MDVVKSGVVLMPDGSIVPRAAITHFIPVPVGPRDNTNRR
jgi:hypothetical protein